LTQGIVLAQGMMLQMKKLVLQYLPVYEGVG
jgi:hypothetical protein